MAVQFLGSQVLFVGPVAMDPDCCCEPPCPSCGPCAGCEEANEVDCPPGCCTPISIQAVWSIGSFCPCNNGTCCVLPPGSDSAIVTYSLNGNVVLTNSTADPCVWIAPAGTRTVRSYPNATCSGDPIIVVYQVYAILERVSGTQWRFRVQASSIGDIFNGVGVGVAGICNVVPGMPNDNVCDPIITNPPDAVGGAVVFVVCP